MVLTEDEFRTLIAGMGLRDLRVEFSPLQRFQLIPVLISKDWEGIADHEREAQVWGFLLGRGERDGRDYSSPFEYIFCYTPAEWEAVTAP